jgi:hypothetical protein
MKNLKLFEDFGDPKSLALPLEEAVEKSMSGSKKSILLLTDGPGVQEAAQVADDLGALLIHIDAGLITPEVFGRPEMTADRRAVYSGRPGMHRSPSGIPQFLPYGEFSSPMILLFSGVNKASGQVLNSLMNLVTRRKTGNYTLPENCIIIVSDSDAEDLGPAMMDRVILAKP